MLHQVQAAISGAALLMTFSATPNVRITRVTFDSTHRPDCNYRAQTHKRRHIYEPTSHYKYIHTHAKLNSHPRTSVAVPCFDQTATAHNSPAACGSTRQTSAQHFVASPFVFPRLELQHLSVQAAPHHKRSVPSLSELITMRPPHYHNVMNHGSSGQLHRIGRRYWSPNHCHRQWSISFTAHGTLIDGPPTAFSECSPHATT